MTGTTMQAYLLYGAKDLRLAEVPRPVAGEDQVLIQVRQVGICGSDVHYYTHGAVGTFVPRAAFALGHEFVGEIAACGARVVGLVPGMRVAIDPSMPCGCCSLCLGGRGNLCLQMRYLGSASCFPHLDGGFAEYVVMPAVNCHPLPASVDDGSAAMLEPLAVALHAVQRATAIGHGVAGRTVLVTGGGTIGQLVAIVARAFGAVQVVVSDPAPFARSIALEGGADGVIDPAAPDSDAALKALAGEGFAIAFEAAGARTALVQALHCVRRGGAIVQIGTLTGEPSLPANMIMAKELTVTGSLRFTQVFALGLHLLADRRLRIGQLVSAIHSYAELPQAMAQAVAHAGVVKVQVRR